MTSNISLPSACRTRDLHTALSIFCDSDRNSSPELLIIAYLAKAADQEVVARSTTRRSMSETTHRSDCLGSKIKLKNTTADHVPFTTSGEHSRLHSIIVSSPDEVKGRVRSRCPDHTTARTRSIKGRSVPGTSELCHRQPLRCPKKIRPSSPSP